MIQLFWQRSGSNGDFSVWGRGLEATRIESLRGGIGKFMELTEWIRTLVPMVTAIGVCVGVLQLFNTKRQAVTAFEDALANEYRQITGKLPTEALLGETLPADLLQKHLSDFYQYFDLTNNQIFLRKIGRISPDTWRFWVDGITTNLARPAFATSWADIGRRSSRDFSELRQLIAENFTIDPKKWSQE
jgi:hypothetical protein